MLRTVRPQPEMRGVVVAPSGYTRKIVPDAVASGLLGILRTQLRLLLTLRLLLLV